jgi:hypothetical protein
LQKTAPYPPQKHSLALAFGAEVKIAAELLAVSKNKERLELLLVSERNDRIHEHRPMSWQIARSKRNGAK